MNSENYHQVRLAHWFQHFWNMGYVHIPDNGKYFPLFKRLLRWNGVIIENENYSYDPETGKWWVIVYNPYWGIKS